MVNRLSSNLQFIVESWSVSPSNSLMCSNMLLLSLYFKVMRRRVRLATFCALGCAYVFYNFFTVLWASVSLATLYIMLLLFDLRCTLSVEHFPIFIFHDCRRANCYTIDSFIGYHRSFMYRRSFIIDFQAE